MNPYFHFTMYRLRLTSTHFERTERMKVTEHFTQLKYDLSASRIPVTFLHVLTALVIVVLQWSHNSSVKEATIFIVSSLVFSVLHWFSNRIYKRVKSTYFLLQGLLIVISCSVVNDYSILILISFGAILVVQSFYIYSRMKEFITFLSFYIVYGVVILFISYGSDDVAFYLFIFIASLVIVFLVLAIFNQKEMEYIASLKANERIEMLTRQNERQRVARDLHDSLIQRLIGVNLKMDVIEAHLQKGNITKVEQIALQVKEQVEESIRDARDVVDNLRDEEEQSFSVRIEEEINYLTSTFFIPIQLHVNTKDPVPNHLSNHVLAIIKEAVTNAHKHAKATRIIIRIEQIDDELSVQIHDDGIGLTLKQLKDVKGHYGLIGMRERVKLCNGTFELDGKNGLKLSMLFPLNEVR